MKNRFLFVFITIIFASCKTTTSEWTHLIKNNSLEGWHYFQDDGTKEGWIVENNILIFNGISDLESGKGDASLLSNKIYEDFEIQFDWKIMSGGNSGFMWGVNEDEKYNYPYQTGQEIQILDHAIYSDPKAVLGGEIELKNVMEDLDVHKHYVGALYDLYAPSVLDAAKPANQWNSFHIKIDYKRNLGEIILNGILINSFPLKGPKWNDAYRKSKFSRSEDFEYLGDARWNDFAKFSKGHICFQDHPGKAYFRNIRIKELH